MKSKKIVEILKDKYFNLFILAFFVFFIFQYASMPSIIPEFLRGTLFERIADYSIKLGFAHAAEYAVLSLLFFRFLYLMEVKHAAVYAASIAIVLGVGAELYQLFIPGRYCDIIDMTCNAIGAIAVQFLGKFRLIFLK